MKFARIAVVLLVSAFALNAQTPPKSSGDEKELNELLNIMQQETDVATKTRVNSDYVPGIVTVLEGPQLEALGVQNAWEALGLVPGMQPVLDSFGSPAAVVRGIDFPFNSGNIQILINGVPLTRADAGMNTASLLIPVEQIERMEVIRGPGSVIYGDFAFMGLVNIVTRKTGDRAYVRGDNRTHSGGGYASWQSGPASISANVSRSTSGNTPVPAIRAHDERTFGVISGAVGGFSLSAEEAKRTFRPTAGPGVDESSWTADARYDHALAPKVHFTSDLSYLSSDIDSGVSALQGHLTKLAASVIFDKWARQSWLAGADYSVSTIDQATHVVPPPPGRPLGPPVLLAANVDRRITGITLQDRIDVRDNVSVTIGARHDTYSDLQSRTTPRLSIVWRASDRHILKAQYAEGFRPPTFFELYQPPPPNTTPRYPFEVNATTELNYIFRTAGRVARATVFRSVISDIIRPGGFVTPGQARATGFELEGTQQLGSRLKLDVNVSHVTTHDPRSTAGPDVVAAGWLANAGLYYEPLRDTFVGLRVNHVGDRYAAAGYDVADLTLARQDIVTRGLTVRAGVKNALNDHPVYIQLRPNGVTDLAIFPGRSVWLQLSFSR